jgi:ABC-2 type transport system ATP-binding protein
MGALRGLPIKESRRRSLELLHSRGHDDWARRPIRTLSKGMAQTVQQLGTIIHRPKLIVLDEPFAGLDAINQEKLEQLIRDQAAAGVTVIFSTHVIAHAERLCERVVIIAEGKSAFEGAVDEARGRLRPIVPWDTRRGRAMARPSGVGHECRREWRGAGRRSQAAAQSLD